MKSASRTNADSAKLFDRFRVLLARPVDGASLAMFRICFGAVMVWHMVKYFGSYQDTNQVDALFARPVMHFTYPGFGWVQAFSEPWMSIHFGVVAMAAALVMLGLFYRTAIVTLFLGYTYIFLMEASLYNNHYYLISLLSFVLIFMPAQRCWSVDRLIAQYMAKRRGETEPLPSTIPFWPVLLLRTQLFLVYFYGGIAKFNYDWLTGEPLLMPGTILHDFLSSTIGLPAAVQPIHLCLFLAWSGLVYDLSIGFLLLSSRTRLLAIAATALFHLHNHFIFPIGIFPAMAFTSTLIFFRPEWPRQLMAWVRRPTWKLWETNAPANDTRKKKGKKNVPAEPRPMPLALGATLALSCFIAWQATWPLRHFFIPGDANWTEEGQDFSWRMMLRAKAAGHLTCRVVDPVLQTTTPEGRPGIDWNACPAGTPQAIHVAIDSHQFNWSHHPGLTITQDPILGRRLIYNPSALHTERDEAITVGTQNVEAQWEKTFARTPRIETTISLTEAVAQIRQDFAVKAKELKLSEASTAEFLRELEALQLQDLAHDDAQPGHESQRAQLVGKLQGLYNSPLADIVRPVFDRLEPFRLQGAPLSGKPLLVIFDPALKDASASETEVELLKLSSGEPYIVWTDFSRLRPDDFRRLPLHYVTFEDRSLHMVWNHYQEIELFQLEKAAVRPWMIHQYAQRVSKRWREVTGRQAQVRVESYVMMNYTIPQMLIDPEADLAAANLNNFSHNTWILPRNYQRMNVATQPGATMQR
ncbi:HTTM domain-containing protein [Bremerella cremea]|uniref:HTTM domain-containing protein n=1 Tax=Bremerella cremea TaxID=1031537 RepID=UPI0031EAB7C3